MTASIERAGSHALLFVLASSLLTSCASDTKGGRDADSTASGRRADSTTVASTGVVDSAGGEATVAGTTGITVGDTAGGAPSAGSDTSKADARWPVKGPAPLPGSLLPNKRIIAYYGNPRSKRMGILGEVPPDQMWARLDREVAKWAKADPSTPVVPALHLIATVAQGDPGKDGMYRLRHPDVLIDQVYGWTKQRPGAIMFLDVQAGWSNVQAELPRFEKYLARPDVHLGIDPEFYMQHKKQGVKPGAKIGQLDASDINWVTNYLAGIVTKYKLPPKVLVIHRFTRPMVSNYKAIRLDPRVQIVIHMDGWGAPWLKRDSYRDYIVAEPVQFAGFKLFYHNDTKKGDPLMQPADLLKLNPKPLYIQYQ